MDYLGLLNYLGLPQWGQYLLIGILLFILISSSAVVLTRAGRNPYFAFLIIVPVYGQVAAIWYLAFSAWPAFKNTSN
jgi:hypothetical protein